MKKIEILEPNLTHEIKYLIQCFKNNEISTYGNFTKKLETEINRIFKCKYSCAVTSGSLALLSAYKNLGIQNNDIVITQSYTFIGTINAIKHASGTPWLFDVNKDNLCLDIEQLEKALKKNTYRKKKFFYHKKTKKRIFGICPVLFNGNCLNFEKLKDISKRYNLKIIIDAAGAIFSENILKKKFNYFDALILSMNGNKNITSGGGGVICSNNKKFIINTRKFVSNFTTKKKYIHTNIGLNLKLTNIHAAIGYGQIKKFSKIKQQKKQVYHLYKKKLKSNKINLLKFSKDILPWLILINIENYKHKKLLIDKFNKNNIKIQNFWIPIHRQKISKTFIHEKMINTNSIWNKVYALPSSTNLQRKNIIKICKIINTL